MDAELWDVDAEAYHADREHENHSSLELFRQSIPAYKAMYVDGTAFRLKSTPAMQLGSAINAIVLEPDRFDELVVEAPDVNRRTKAGREAWDEFEMENADRTIIKRSDMASIKAMAAALAADEEAQKWLTAPGRNEQAVRWQDPKTGVRLKCLCDRLLHDGPVINLKTAVDVNPPGFSRSVVNFGYHRQAATYALGVTLLNGSPARHVWVLVQNAEPYETAVYELDEEGMELGRAQVYKTLYDLKDCRDLENWRGRWSGKLNTLSLPRYAFSAGLAYQE